MYHACQILCLLHNGGQPPIKCWRVSSMTTNNFPLNGFSEIALYPCTQILLKWDEIVSERSFITFKSGLILLNFIHSKFSAIIL